MVEASVPPSEFYTGLVAQLYGSLRSSPPFPDHDRLRPTSDTREPTKRSRKSSQTSRKDVLPSIERVGGAPVIIKLIEGTQGIGVLLAESTKAAESIIELLQSQKQNVLIQKFVAESKARDIRAFVVGDQVVAAMRRVAQGQDFRSNVHRGGLAEPVELSEEYRETAVRCTQILGLRVAGVDMLEAATKAAAALQFSGSNLNGANLTGFWDGGERLAPADTGDGFEDERLGDFAHFSHDFFNPFVVLDGLKHLRGLLFGQSDTGSLALHLERPAP